MSTIDRVLVSRQERLIDYIVVLGPKVENGEFVRDVSRARSDSFTIEPIYDLALIFGKDTVLNENNWQRVNSVKNQTVNLNTGYLKTNVSLFSSRRFTPTTPTPISNVIVHSLKDKDNITIPKTWAPVSTKRFGREVTIYVERDASAPPVVDVLIVDLDRGEMVPPGYKVCGTNMNDNVGGRQLVLCQRTKAQLPSASASTISAHVLSRCPRLDYADNLLDAPGLAQLCFPSGVSITDRLQLPTFLTFVATKTDGTEVFGAALTCFDRVSAHCLCNDADYAHACPLHTQNSRAGSTFLRIPSLATSSVHNTRQPAPQAAGTRARAPSTPLFACHCLCLVSRWPFLAPFKALLEQLYRVSLTYPLEPFVLRLLLHARLPKPGVAPVIVPMGHARVPFAFPPRLSLPYVSPAAGLSLTELFSCLSVPNIIAVWRHLIAEGRVLLFSSSHTILAPVAEALRSLLFPFRWQCMFIPILPSIMAYTLRAPFPFLVGVHRSFLDTVRVAHDVLLVDLDSNRLRLPLAVAPEPPSLLLADPPMEVGKGKGSAPAHHPRLPSLRYTPHCSRNQPSCLAPPLPRALYDALETRLHVLMPLFSGMDRSACTSSHSYLPENDLAVDLDLDFHDDLLPLMPGKLPSPPPLPNGGVPLAQSAGYRHSPFTDDVSARLQAGLPGEAPAAPADSKSKASKAAAERVALAGENGALVVRDGQVCVLPPASPYVAARGSLNALPSDHARYLLTEAAGVEAGQAKDALQGAECVRDSFLCGLNAAQFREVGARLAFLEALCLLVGSQLWRATVKPSLRAAQWCVGLRGAEPKGGAVEEPCAHFTRECARAEAVHAAVVRGERVSASVAETVAAGVSECVAAESTDDLLLSPALRERVAPVETDALLLPVAGDAADRARGSGEEDERVPTQECALARAVFGAQHCAEWVSGLLYPTQEAPLSVDAPPQPTVHALSVWLRPPLRAPLRDTGRGSISSSASVQQPGAGIVQSAFLAHKYSTAPNTYPYSFPANTTPPALTTATTASPYHSALLMGILVELATNKYTHAPLTVPTDTTPASPTARAAPTVAARADLPQLLLHHHTRVQSALWSPYNSLACFAKPEQSAHATPPTPTSVALRVGQWGLGLASTSFFQEACLRLRAHTLAVLDRVDATARNTALRSEYRSGRHRDDKPTGLSSAAAPASFLQVSVSSPALPVGKLTAGERSAPETQVPVPPALLCPWSVVRLLQWPSVVFGKDAPHVGLPPRVWLDTYADADVAAHVAAEVAATSNSNSSPVVVSGAAATAPLPAHVALLASLDCAVVVAEALAGLALSADDAEASASVRAVFSALEGDVARTWMGRGEEGGAGEASTSAGLSLSSAKIDALYERSRKEPASDVVGWDHPLPFADTPCAGPDSRESKEAKDSGRTGVCVSVGADGCVSVSLRPVAAAVTSLLEYASHAVHAVAHALPTRPRHALLAAGNYARAGAASLSASDSDDSDVECYSSEDEMPLLLPSFGSDSAHATRVAADNARNDPDGQVFAAASALERRYARAACPLHFSTQCVCRDGRADISGLDTHVSVVASDCTDHPLAAAPSPSVTPAPTIYGPDRPAPAVLALRSLSEAHAVLLDAVAGPLSVLTARAVQPALDALQVAQRSGARDMGIGLGAGAGHNGAGASGNAGMGWGVTGLEPFMDTQPVPAPLSPFAPVSTASVAGAASGLTPALASLTALAAPNRYDNACVPSVSDSAPAAPLPPLALSVETALPVPLALASAAAAAPPLAAPTALFPSSPAAWLATQTVTAAVHDFWTYLYVSRPSGPLAAVTRALAFGDGPCSHQCLHTHTPAADAEPAAPSPRPRVSPTPAAAARSPIGARSLYAAQTLAPARDLYAAQMASMPATALATAPRCPPPSATAFRAYHHSLRALAHLATHQLKLPEPHLLAHIERHLNAVATARGMTAPLLAHVAALMHRANKGAAALHPDIAKILTRFPELATRLARGLPAEGIPTDTALLPALPSVPALLSWLRVAAEQDLLVLLSQLLHQVSRRCVPLASTLTTMLQMLQMLGMEQAAASVRVVFANHVLDFAVDKGAGVQAAQPSPQVEFSVSRTIFSTSSREKTPSSSALPAANAPYSTSSSLTLPPAAANASGATTPASARVRGDLTLRRGVGLSGLVALSCGAAGYVAATAHSHHAALCTLANHTATHHAHTQAHTQAQASAAVDNTVPTSASTNAEHATSPAPAATLTDLPVPCLPWPAQCFVTAACPKCRLSISSAELLAAYAALLHKSLVGGAGDVDDALECWGCGALVSPRVTVVFDGDGCAQEYCRHYYANSPALALDDDEEEDEDEEDTEGVHVAADADADAPDAAAAGDDEEVLARAYALFKKTPSLAYTHAAPSPSVDKNPRKTPEARRARATPQYLTLPLISPLRLRAQVDSLLAQHSYSPDAFVYDAAPVGAGTPFAEDGAAGGSLPYGAALQYAMHELCAEALHPAHPQPSDGDTGSVPLPAPLAARLPPSPLSVVRAHPALLWSAFFFFALRDAHHCPQPAAMAHAQTLSLLPSTAAPSTAADQLPSGPAAEALAGLQSLLPANVVTPVQMLLSDTPLARAHAFDAEALYAPGDRAAADGEGKSDTDAVADAAAAAGLSKLPVYVVTQPAGGTWVLYRDGAAQCAAHAATQPTAALSRADTDAGAPVCGGCGCVVADAATPESLVEDVALDRALSTGPRNTVCEALAPFVSVLASCDSASGPDSSAAPSRPVTHRIAELARTTCGEFSLNASLQMALAARALCGSAHSTLSPLAERTPTARCTCACPMPARTSVLSEAHTRARARELYRAYFAYNSVLARTTPANPYHLCPRPAAPLLDQQLFAPAHSLFSALRQLDAPAAITAAFPAQRALTDTVRVPMVLRQPPLPTGLLPAAIAARVGARPLCFPDMQNAPRPRPLRTFLRAYVRALVWIREQTEALDALDVDTPNALTPAPSPPRHSAPATPRAPGAGIYSQLSSPAARSAAMAGSAPVSPAAPAPMDIRSLTSPPDLHPAPAFAPLAASRGHLRSLARELRPHDYLLSRAYVELVEAAESLWGSADLCSGFNNGVGLGPAVALAAPQDSVEPGTAVFWSCVQPLGAQTLPPASVAADTQPEVDAAVDILAKHARTPLPPAIARANARVPVLLHAASQLLAEWDAYTHTAVSTVHLRCAPTAWSAMDVPLGAQALAAAVLALPRAPTAAHAQRLSTGFLHAALTVLAATANHHQLAHNLALAAVHGAAADDAQGLGSLLCAPVVAALPPPLFPLLNTNAQLGRGASTLAHVANVRNELIKQVRLRQPKPTPAPTPATASAATTTPAAVVPAKVIVPLPLASLRPLLSQSPPALLDLYDAYSARSTHVDTTISADVLSQFASFCLLRDGAPAETLFPVLASPAYDAHAPTLLSPLAMLLFFRAFTRCMRALSGTQGVLQSSTRVRTWEISTAHALPWREGPAEAIVWEMRGQSLQHTPLGLGAQFPFVAQPRDTDRRFDLSSQADVVRFVHALCSAAADVLEQYLAQGDHCRAPTHAEADAAAASTMHSAAVFTPSPCMLPPQTREYAADLRQFPDDVRAGQVEVWTEAVGTGVLLGECFHGWVADAHAQWLQLATASPAAHPAPTPTPASPAAPVGETELVGLNMDMCVGMPLAVDLSSGAGEQLDARAGIYRLSVTRRTTLLPPQRPSLPSRPEGSLSISLDDIELTHLNSDGVASPLVVTDTLAAGVLSPTTSLGLPDEEKSGILIGKKRFSRKGDVTELAMMSTAAPTNEIVPVPVSAPVDVDDGYTEEELRAMQAAAAERLREVDSRLRAQGLEPEALSAGYAAHTSLSGASSDVAAAVSPRSDKLPRASSLVVRVPSTAQRTGLNSAGKPALFGAERAAHSASGALSPALSLADVLLDAGEGEDDK